MNGMSHGGIRVKRGKRRSIKGYKGTTGDKFEWRGTGMAECYREGERSMLAPEASYSTALSAVASSANPEI
jgi:hypothetical protein